MRLHSAASLACGRSQREERDQRGAAWPKDAEYRFYCEFQSHEPEFDYLKSLEIEEKINALRWCKGSMGSKMLLSTNDKTIKLWKIYGKKIKTVSNMNIDPPPSPPRAPLSLPPPLA